MASKPTKIAIIEDDVSLQEMYKFSLENAGFTVGIASDGVEGLSLLQSFMPDLILLDLMMPNMSGDEMLVKLRAQPWGATMPVLILTNISEGEAPKTLANLNVERYIIKAHTTPHQVVEIVRKTLGHE